MNNINKDISSINNLFIDLFRILIRFIMDIGLRNKNTLSEFEIKIQLIT